MHIRGTDSALGYIYEYSSESSENVHSLLNQFFEHDTQWHHSSTHLTAIQFNYDSARNSPYPFFQHYTQYWLSNGQQANTHHALSATHHTNTELASVELASVSQKRARSLTCKAISLLAKLVLESQSAPLHCRNFKHLVIMLWTFYLFGGQGSPFFRTAEHRLKQIKSDVNLESTYIIKPFRLNDSATNREKCAECDWQVFCSAPCSISPPVCSGETACMWTVHK